MHVCMQARENFKLFLFFAREKEKEKKERRRRRRRRRGEKERERKRKIDFVLLHPSRSLVRTNVHIYRSVRCTCYIHIDSVATIIDLYYILSISWPPIYFWIPMKLFNNNKRWQPLQLLQLLTIQIIVRLL